ncbi:unnamed protein product, partial [Rotaria sp. Silwood1]
DYETDKTIEMPTTKLYAALAGPVPSDLIPSDISIGAIGDRLIGIIIEQIL